MIHPSCSSLSPLWSSNEYDIITVGAEHAEARELVQEHPDELTLFLEEHKEKIYALIRLDEPGWKDRLSLALEEYWIFQDIVEWSTETNLL